MLGEVKETGGLSVRGVLTNGVVGAVKVPGTLDSGLRRVFVLVPRGVFGVKKERGAEGFWLVLGTTLVLGAKKLLVLDPEGLRVEVLGTKLVLGAKKLRLGATLVFGARKVRGVPTFVFGATLVFGAKKLFLGVTCVEGARKD